MRAGCRDKADAAEARLLGDSHEFDHLAVGHGLIGPELDFSVGLGGGHTLQGSRQSLFANGLVVQKQFTGLIQAEVDGFRRFAGLRTLSRRQVQAKGAGQQGRRQNEDDQQHQHDVDQRRDIDLAKGLGLWAAGETTECHGREKREWADLTLATGEQIQKVLRKTFQLNFNVGH
jgi:hypothetical protein